jgi:hypothetical protein
MVKKRRSVVEIAIHFEADEKAKNISLMQALLNACPDLGSGAVGGIESAERGARFTFVQFALPYDTNMPNESIARESARLMLLLIERTVDILKKMS